MKQNVVKQLYPEGKGIQAVLQLQRNIRNRGHDHFFIPHIEEETSTVMTTSREKLQFACELSGHGNELWSQLTGYANRFST